MRQLERYSHHQLQVATDNFSVKNILGRGANGNVYKGRLVDGTLVAIKWFRKEQRIGAAHTFQTEVEAFSIMPGHRNLLSLWGFCMTSKGWLLVYPYMENGSLGYCLRERPSNVPPLDWWRRKRIALGCARGLSYLHNHCDAKIIHLDVKAANILLDEEYEAVVGDFGMAKFMDHNETDVTIDHVCGTIGHIAPEYLFRGKISPESDVFSYGVTLLELITGQREFDLRHLKLFDWVKGLLEEKKLETLVDPDLQENYVEEEVEQLIQVSLLCTQPSALGRPEMSEVVRLLDGDGLAERWDEWQKDGLAQRWDEWLLRELEPVQQPTFSLTFTDSMEDLDSVELSGPR